MPSMKIPHNKVTYPEELVWPIGSQDLRFIRTTDRYDDKGTISNNRGYLKVMRDMSTGQFRSISC